MSSEDELDAEKSSRASIPCQANSENLTRQAKVLAPDTSCSDQRRLPASNQKFELTIPEMAHSNLAHRRTHNLLLISQLLSQRGNASPFTLIQDSLEQPARPLLHEYIRRANLSKTHVVYLSFETIKPPDGADTFIRCFDKTASEVTQAVLNTVTASDNLNKRFLILVDSLMYLSTWSTLPGTSINLTAYLSSLLTPPKQAPAAQTPIVAIYHSDIPISTSSTPYAPSPLSTLSYLATTIITVHSLAILLAEKAARERSLAAPVFGLAEELEGVVIGLKPWPRLFNPAERGIVLELEHRRKSGRGVLEWYFLPTSGVAKAQPTPQGFRETVTLLDDHQLFRKQKDESISDEELAGLTFELGLTDRQKQEREGVVLPYMDAQKAGGGGEGGRILYDMGVEDDFDEEEDEI